MSGTDRCSGLFFRVPPGDIGIQVGLNQLQAGQDHARVIQFAQHGNHIGDQVNGGDIINQRADDGIGFIPIYELMEKETA